MASTGDVAVERPSAQPFLKELLERQSSSSLADFAREEMPPLKDVQMVMMPATEIPEISQQEFRLAMKDMKWPEPVKRGDSENSSESRTSIGSTADMSSFGESSLSTMLSTGRLYGRDQEEELLRSAFRRIVSHKAPRPSSFVLINGSSGSGKTRLAESLRSHVASVGGYFCSGKYDQHQNDPFEPLCAAFNDYVTQLLEEDDVTIRAARRRIHAAVEKDLYSLSKMIPPLHRLMEDELMRMDGGNVACAHCNQEKGRSMFAMNKLMRAIASPERPVVMMLDDIQWASSCPLQKWRGMIQDDMNEGIMFIGVCQDDVAPTSPLSNFLRDLEEQDHVEISNVHVKSLEKSHIQEMINDLFFMPVDQSESLATFVFQNSAGNAYFVVESLKMLQVDAGVLSYNIKEKTWEFNAEVCCQSSNQCPLDFIQRKLRSLPRDCQKVIMAASCLGSNISERLLEVALQEPVGDRFQQLVQKGKLSFNETRKTYSFKHNAFQSACYDLISEELKPAFHLEIGLRLWKHLNEDELGQNIFLVLNQLKQGVTLMRKQADRYEVATLCLTAAEKAAAQYSFPTASSYLRFAFVLLGQNHWKEAYDLSLVLYNYAAEVEFAQGDSDRVDFLIDEVLKNAKNNEDKFRAYNTKIYALGVRGKTEDSVDLGISCLKSLGVNITPQCHKVHLTWSWSRVAMKLRGKSDQMLKRLPPMRDPEKLAAMQILNMLFLNTHISKKELFPFVVLKMMKLTLFHGVSAFSSIAFAGYGSLLCYSGKVEEGLRFGRLALDLVEELNAQSYYARVGAFVWGAIFVHSRPFVDSLEQLKSGHRLGLQTGDIEFAMLNAHLHMMFMIDSGNYRVSSMLDHLTDFKDLTALHGHTNQFGALDLLTNTLKKFRDPDTDLTDHSGALDDGLKLARTNSCIMALDIAFNSKIFLYFCCGDYKAGIGMINDRDSLRIAQYEGSILECFSLFVDGLTFFGESRRAKDSAHSKDLVKRARNCIRQLRAFATKNPAVAMSKLVLLEAENAAIKKAYAAAEEKYDHAAGIAHRHRNMFELAFAKYVAGEHYHNDIGDEGRAIACFEDACSSFETLEGRSVISHLRRKIVSLSESR